MDFNSFFFFNIWFILHFFIPPPVFFWFTCCFHSFVEEKKADPENGDAGRAAYSKSLGLSAICVELWYYAMCLSPLVSIKYQCILMNVVFILENRCCKTILGFMKKITLVWLQQPKSHISTPIWMTYLLPYIWLCKRVALTIKFITN